MRIKAIVIINPQNNKVINSAEKILGGNAKALTAAAIENLAILSKGELQQLEQDDGIFYMQRKGSLIYAFAADAQIEEYDAILKNIEFAHRNKQSLNDILSSPQQYAIFNGKVRVTDAGVAKVKGLVADSKAAAHAAADRLIARGEAIDGLKNKAADLKETAVTFNRASRQLNVNVFWQACCGGTFQCCAACGCIPCCCDKTHKTPNAQKSGFAPSTPLMDRGNLSAASVNGSYHADDCVSTAANSESGEATAPRCCCG